MAGTRRDIRVFTNTVKDGMNTFSVCYLQDSLNGVFFLVDDDVVSAVLLGKRGLLLGGGSSDDSSATRFGELAKKKTQAAGNGMDEYDITLLDVVCFLHKGNSSEALSECRNRSTG